MNKTLTRRAKEYFEVLDELRSKGYITNEEWQLLSVQEQESSLRMTNRIIEDSLLEHGYSKGLPTEQKKYRHLWMQERGVDPKATKETKSKILESDPILSAVTALKKQLNDEARVRVEEANQKADKRAGRLEEQLRQAKQKKTKNSKKAKGKND